jgi:NDP-sugar pyrophosphorylase family protein
MQGLILSGGRGTRLGKNYAKGLIDYGGQSLIQHNINLLAQYCESIVVVTGFDSEHLTNSITAHKEKITFMEDQQGVISAMQTGIGQLSNDFIFCLGDEILFDHNLQGMIEMFNDKQALGVIGACARTNYLEKIRATFSIEHAINDRIIKLIEKPTVVINNRQGTGYGIFKKEFVNFVKPIHRHYPDTVQYAINQDQPVYVYDLCREFYNINTPTDLMELQSRLG